MLPPSSLALLFKGSLVDLRLRASNEHLPLFHNTIVRACRVPRAGRRPGCPSYLSKLARSLLQQDGLIGLKRARVQYTMVLPSLLVPSKRGGPFGLSLRTTFSPSQPRRAETRLSSGEHRPIDAPSKLARCCFQEWHPWRSDCGRRASAAHSLKFNQSRVRAPGPKDQYGCRSSYP
jgi:hypothetical protein